MLNCNYLVIGGGQTGLILARNLAQSGKQVILAEQAELGGTYLLSQELPKLLLLRAAQEFSTSLKLFKNYPETFNVLKKHRQKIGLNIFNQIQAYKQLLRTSTKNTKNLRLINGVVEFSSKTLVEINSSTERHLVNFDTAVISVGKNTLTTPSLPGISKINFLHQHNIYLFEEIPNHLAIIGITRKNLEIANLYADLGIKVTLFEEKDSLGSLHHLDRSGFNYIVKQLLAKQVDFQFQNKIVKAEKLIDGLVLENSRGERVKFSHVYFQAKEIFADDNLKLNKVGINWTPKGIITNSNGQTQQRHIWALGESNNQSTDTNKFAQIYDFLDRAKTSSTDNSKINLTSSFIPLQLTGNHIEPLKVNDYKIKSDLPVTTIGMTESQAAAKFGQDMEIDIVDSALIEGFLKIIVKSGSRQIVGVTLAGEFCSCLEHFTLKSMQKNLFYSDYRNYIKTALGV